MRIYRRYSTKSTSSDRRVWIFYVPDDDADCSAKQGGVDCEYIGVVRVAEWGGSDIGGSAGGEDALGREGKVDGCSVGSVIEDDVPGVVGDCVDVVGIELYVVDGACWCGEDDGC